jgi:DNA-binding CsgD family transcriptional regulator
MLTTREQEVIALIAEGYRTREMAELLSVSPRPTHNDISF